MVEEGFVCHMAGGMVERHVKCHYLAVLQEFLLGAEALRAFGLGAGRVALVYLEAKVDEHGD